MIRNKPYEIDHKNFGGMVILQVIDIETEKDVYRFNFDEKDPQTIYYKKQEARMQRQSRYYANALQGIKYIYVRFRLIKVLNI